MARFHGDQAAAAAHEAFVSRFRQGVVPEDLPVTSVAADAEGLQMAALLVAAGLTQSNGEGMRLIKQGAVRLDGDPVKDARHTVYAGQSCLLQVGKRRIARVQLEAG